MHEPARRAGPAGEIADQLHTAPHRDVLVDQQVHHQRAQIHPLCRTAGYAALLLVVPCGDGDDCWERGIMWPVEWSGSEVVEEGEQGVGGVVAAG